MTKKKKENETKRFSIYLKSGNVITGNFNTTIIDGLTRAKKNECMLIHDKETKLNSLLIDRNSVEAIIPLSKEEIRQKNN